jgi:hypothetical protein
MIATKSDSMSSTATGPQSSFGIVQLPTCMKLEQDESRPHQPWRLVLSQAGLLYVGYKLIKY